MKRADRLVEAFMPLVGGVARIYRGSPAVDQSELMQACGREPSPAELADGAHLSRRQVETLVAERSPRGLEEP